MAKLIYLAKFLLLILPPLLQELIKEDTGNLIDSLLGAKVDNHTTRFKILATYSQERVSIYLDLVLPHLAVEAY